MSKKRYVIDSSAWIEILRGSTRANPLKEFFETGELYTSSICVAEILQFIIKADKNINTKEIIETIQTSSTIIPITLEIASQAAPAYVKYKKEISKLSHSDAFTIIIAQELKASILTFDTDFRKIDGALIFN